MGTSYTGKKIKNTFGSIIKVSDNSNLTAIAKQLSDGLGNDTGIFISTGSELGVGITPSEALHISGNGLFTGNINAVNGTFSGNITSLGIDDNATSTAITIDSSENVRFEEAIFLGDTSDITFGPYIKDTDSGDGILAFFDDRSSGGFRIYGVYAVNGAANELFTVTDQAVKLNYDNSNKLITTLTGVTVTGNLAFDGLTDSGEGITITKFVDAADTIAANNNDTTIPTSAAVKSYVDSNITAQDLDFSGTSGTGSIDLDSQTFAIVGTTNEIETSASNQQIQIGLPDNVTIGNQLSVTGDLNLQACGQIRDVSGDMLIENENNSGHIYLKTKDSGGNFVNSQITNSDGSTFVGTVAFDSLKDTGENITITKFVDEADGIGSNDNDTTIPTSAAVKDYVDTNVTAQDLDFSGDSGTGSVDLDSQTFAVVGTANEIET